MRRSSRSSAGRSCTKNHGAGSCCDRAYPAGRAPAPPAEPGFSAEAVKPVADGRSAGRARRRARLRRLLMLGRERRTAPRCGAAAIHRPVVLRTILRLRLQQPETNGMAATRRPILLGAPEEGKGSVTRCTSWASAIAVRGVDVLNFPAREAGPTGVLYSVLPDPRRRRGRACLRWRLGTGRDGRRGRTGPGTDAAARGTSLGGCRWLGVPGRRPRACRAGGAGGSSTVAAQLPVPDESPGIAGDGGPRRRCRLSRCATGLEADHPGGAAPGQAARLASTARRGGVAAVGGDERRRIPVARVVVFPSAKHQGAMAECPATVPASC